MAAIALIAGVFMAVAGPLSGFGNDALVARIGWCLVGVVLACAGLAALYYAKGRDWSKTVDTILNIILLNWR